MKTLNTYFIVIIISMLILSSCEDNFEITELEETTSEPTQVGVVLLEGQVLDINDNPIPDAEVNINHAGKIVSTTANNDGYYSIELPHDDSRVLIQANAEDYLTSGVNAVTLNNSTKKNDVKLLQSDDLDYGGQVALMSMSTNGVLSGQIIMEDNSSAANLTIVLLDIATFTLNSYDITDQDGKYEIAVDPFENNVLLAISDCDGTETIAEIITHGSEDQDFGTTETRFNEIEQFSVSGYITNCNTGDSVNSGRVGISFDGNSKYYYGNIVEGQYDIIVDNCLKSDCYNVTVTAPAEVEGILEVNCVEITGDQMEGDYVLCGEDVSTIGEFRLLVGTDSLILNNGQALINPTTGYWRVFGNSADLTDILLIDSEADDVGIFGVEMVGLSAQSINVGGSIDQSGSPFEFEITEINEYLKGKISGDITASDGSQIPLSGTFEIKL